MSRTGRILAWTGGVIAGGAALFAGVVSVVGCALSAPPWEGARSPRFDGEKFRNEEPIADHGFADFLAWRFTAAPGPWDDVADAEPGPPPPRRVSDGRLRVTFVNHATALIQMDGKNILTDPIWSERASPVSWAGPRRVRPPGIRFADLPPIDAVIVSHNHYDHLDLPTLRRIAETHAARFYVPLGNGALLAGEGIARDRIAELDWRDEIALGDGVRVVAVPAQHFSGRGLADRNETLWAGYVIAGPSGRVYFAGDTGFGGHFAEMARRYGPFRLALLPIGAFRPIWFMGGVHLSPADAVRAHGILGEPPTIGIHFGTFPLADDGQREPVDALAAARDSAGISPEKFRTLGFGEAWEVPPVAVGAGAEVSGAANR